MAGEAGRRSAAGNAAKAGTNTSGAGGLYSKPEKVIWAEQDAVVGRGTTENNDEYLRTWGTAIAIFKKFMDL